MDPFDQVAHSSKMVIVMIRPVLCQNDHIVRRVEQMEEKKRRKKIKKTKLKGMKMLVKCRGQRRRPIRRKELRYVAF